MSHVEKIYQTLEDLKSSAIESAPAIFGNLAVAFTQLSREEQRQFTARFFDWAKSERKRSKAGALKFRYAKFLSGLFEFLSDHHEAALRDLNEARAMFEENDDKHGVGMSHVVTAGIYRTLGDYDLALKISWEAYDLLKSYEPFRHFILAGIMNMANIYLEMHNSEEAVRLFREAYEQSQASHNTYWLNYSLHGLGKAYLQEKKYAEAQEFFEKALALSETNGSKLGIANSLTELAHYHFQAGELGRAEELNGRALVIREEEHFTGGSVTNYMRLGEVYLKEARLEKALEVLKKGLEVAEQIKVKPKVYQIHFMLSEVYQKMNEPQKSLEEYRKFHTVREQVEVEDSRRKLKNAKTIFEAEQTKKENAIIKRQKEEIEKKNAELQETIDELTRARVGKKARAVTLVIAIVLFIINDTILGTALHWLPTDNYFISLGVKMLIIFSLRPINGYVEKILFRRVMKERKRNESLQTSPEGLPPSDVQTAS
jgi:tetratricopeptide (TPR) repeat protein